MPKEKPLETPEHWNRFFRERKRADNAITNREFWRWVMIWAGCMLAAHFAGRW